MTVTYFKQPKPAEAAADGKPQVRSDWARQLGLTPEQEIAVSERAHSSLMTGKRFAFVEGLVVGIGAAIMLLVIYAALDRDADWARTAQSAESVTNWLTERRTSDTEQMTERLP